MIDLNSKTRFLDHITFDDLLICCLKHTLKSNTFDMPVCFISLQSLQSPKSSSLLEVALFLAFRLYRSPVSLVCLSPVSPVSVRLQAAASKDTFTFAISSLCLHLDG